MRLRIRLDYIDRTYFSDWLDCNEQLKANVLKSIERVSKGGVDFFSIKEKNNEYYFTKEILSKSIITVIVE